MKEHQDLTWNDLYAWAGKKLSHEGFPTREETRWYRYISSQVRVFMGRSKEVKSIIR